MSNVIALNVRPRRQPLPRRLAYHAALFCGDRRGPDDVFWLKENAEYLNILEVTGQSVPEVLEIYGHVYETIEDRLGAHPQYYRFLLSICLDLEDLGIGSEKGEALCAWVHAQGLPEAELSDLQRAEAERLLARRGIGTRNPALDARLHRFIDRCETFCIPNKKAAYELTHIVFYLSEYGRRDPELSDRAIQSLIYAGLLAYLDQNYDLLAEVCIAMTYAGARPSRIWQGAVMSALRAAGLREGESPSPFDDYHAYFVSSWLAGLCGQTLFPLVMEGPGRIDMPAPPARPLRDMSAALDDLRTAPWFAARNTLLPRLDESARQVLQAAESSTGKFEEFYASFARGARPLGAQA